MMRRRGRDAVEIDCCSFSSFAGLVTAATDIFLAIALRVLRVCAIVKRDSEIRIAAIIDSFQLNFICGCLLISNVAVGLGHRNERTGMICREITERTEITEQTEKIWFRSFRLFRYFRSFRNLSANSA